MGLVHDIPFLLSLCSAVVGVFGGFVYVAFLTVLFIPVYSFTHTERSSQMYSTHDMYKNATRTGIFGGVIISTTWLCSTILISKFASSCSFLTIFSNFKVTTLGFHVVLPLVSIMAFIGIPYDVTWSAPIGFIVGLLFSIIFFVARIRYRSCFCCSLCCSR